MMQRFWRVLPIAAITGLGFFLRFQGIDGPSFKIWDDFFALRVAVKDMAGIIHFLAHQTFDGYQEFQPPLYYFVVHAFLELGKTDAMARMTGVLAGTLSIPVLYLMGKRLFGRGGGLTAALLLAVSLYHIEYSQEIRNYVMFLFLALCSMLCLLAWLQDRTLRVLPWFVLSTLAMMYTSYLGMVVLFAQSGIWLAYVCAERGTPLLRRVIRQWPILAAWAAAGMGYLPWLPVYAKTYAVLHSIRGNVRPPLTSSLALALREFTSYYADTLGYPESVWPMVALGALGVLLGLSRGGRQGLRLSALFLLLWAGMTLLVVFGFNREGLHVRPRHIIVVLPVLLLFAGLALASMGAWFRRPAIGVCAVLAMVALLNSFNLRALPFFYRREDDRLKDLCHYMAVNKRDTQALTFWGSDSKWMPVVSDFMQSWYVPGVFESFADGYQRRYVRTWLLSSPQFREQLQALPALRFQRHIGYVDCFLAGIANTSPVVLAFEPGEATFSLREDFSSPLAYGLIHESHNVTLDRGVAELRNLNSPGSLTYAFTVPEGAVCQEMRLGLEATLVGTVEALPNSSLTVSACADGSGDGDFTPVAVFSLQELAAKAGSAFNGRTVSIREDLVLPAGIGQVRLDLNPGAELGVIKIAALTFSARGQGAKPGGKTAGRMRLEHLLANAKGQPLMVFSSREREVGLPGGLLGGAPGVMVNGVAGGLPGGVANDVADSAVVRIGGAADHAAFKRENPDLHPILILPDGADAYFCYDPALTAPSQLASVVPGGPARSLVAEGGMDAPGAGSTGVLLPSAGRTKAFVSMNFEGQGTLLLSPVFEKGNSASITAREVQEVVVSPNEECLTCKDASPCSLTYTITSPFPITRIAVRAYPRLYGDWKLANSFRVSLKADGHAFEPLDGMRSNASGRWDGWRVPRGVIKELPLPAREISLRFDLSGDGAQMWSTPEFPMLIQAEFLAPARSEATGEIFGVRSQMLAVPVGSFTNLLRSY